MKIGPECTRWQPRTGAYCKFCCRHFEKEEGFYLKEGPSRWYFCSQGCSAKWVHFRHVVGAYAILKLDKKDRELLLEGKQLDQYLRDNNIF